MQNLDQKLAQLEIKEQASKAKSTVKSRLLKKIQNEKEDDSDDDSNTNSNIEIKTMNLLKFIIKDLHKPLNCETTIINAVNLCNRLHDEIKDLDYHHDYDIDFTQYIISDKPVVIDDFMSSELMSKAMEAYNKDISSDVYNRGDSKGDNQKILDDDE